MRLTLIALLLACPCLYAQDSETLDGSVPSNRRLTFLYEIDFGAISQAWTVNVSLNTNAASGLAVSLIDVDALASSAQVAPTAIDTAVVAGSGTASATLNGNYDSVHQFAVEIQTAQGTTASDYSGALTVNLGSATFIKQDQFIISAIGLKTAVGKFAFWDGSIPAGSTMAMSLQLDFGAGPHTEFIRLEGIGTNISKIEFIDNTGGTASILATFNNPSAGDVTAVPLNHSGDATIRINVTAGAGSPGLASWAVSVPSNLELSRVGDPGEGGDNDSCSSSATSGGLLSWLAVLAGAVVVLRLARPAKAARPARIR